MGSGVALCKCQPGYHGEACGQKDCPMRQCPTNDLTKMCSGNGLCVNGTCSCHDMFFGTDCGHKKCPKDCSGHGTCDTMTGTCNCKACKSCAQAWGGVACDMRTCPDDCNKNGLCANGLCVCFEGFSGLNCSITTGKK